MRAGGCTVQQALTNEAANVVKQAVTLARRRGHAQVTPLHVANTMLSASTGLLRTACIQSHSHPLQCRALELCFNVALNRLPASSSSSPMLGGHHSQCPSISNALVAAFKRAQAHQRRGGSSLENQQQPLLAVKIELDQLIISILDDPSVSRVMREAGFSSTQVKSNVEQAVSLEISSQNNTPPPPPSKSSKERLNSSSSNNSGNLVLSPVSETGKEEDVMYVIENLVKKKRTSIVVVGESVSSVEGVVRGVIEKVGKGDVPECLRHVKFINLPLSCLANLNRVEVEQRVEELKSHLRTAEIVLNMGDLKWGTVENREISSSREYYCPVEHMMMEIGILLGCCNNGDEISSSGNMGFRVIGFATSQTYMRCKSGHPSLETLWGLHPLTIPPGSLSLSLITTTHSDGNEEIDDDDIDEVEKKLNCCADCSANFRNQLGSLRSIKTSTNESTASPLLPPWFQHYKDTVDQSKGVIGSNIDKECGSISVSELCKKWNSFCNSAHKQPYISCFSHDHHHQQQCWRSDGQFWLQNYNKEYPKQQATILSRSNPNSTPNSVSNSSADVVMEPYYVHKFKELNAENLTTLCTALENKVPWQKHIVPEIVTTILKCRSGMLRRWNRIDDEDDESWSSSSSSSSKQETWLFFQGGDVQGKEMIARELARLVFGSQINMVTIALSSFINHQEDSSRNLKRSRDEQSCMDRFAEAVSSNPHRVFFIEDVEQADYCSQMRFKRAIERGRISNANGEEASLSDAIIILSCESSSSSSSSTQKRQEEEEVGALDLNISYEDTIVEEQSIQDINGLLQSVDRRIIFNIKELLLLL